jgi:folate-dependent phosphoribosylglycinamide formyltransferase PurN
VLERGIGNFLEGSPFSRNAFVYRPCWKLLPAALCGVVAHRHTHTHTRTHTYTHKKTHMHMHTCMDASTHNTHTHTHTHQGPYFARNTYTHTRDPTFLDNLRQLQPDLCITAAYGNILPQAFLDTPAHGTLNVHPSLLPKCVGFVFMCVCVLCACCVCGCLCACANAGVHVFQCVVCALFPLACLLKY